MMIVSKMAVTDSYSHHETNEDVMRKSRNTIGPFGIWFAGKLGRQKLQDYLVVQCKNTAITRGFSLTI